MEKTKYVFERLVTLDPTLVQFFYAPEATQEGSTRNKEKAEDREGLEISQRREEAEDPTLGWNVDMHLLPGTNLEMGRMCHCSHTASGTKTRPKTRRRQSRSISRTV